MPRLTLGTAKTKLSDFAPTDKLTERINAACSTLIDEGRFLGCTREVAFTARYGQIALPRNCSALLGVRVDDTVTPIAGTFFSFLPGRYGVSSSFNGVAIDQGEGHATIVVVPAGGTLVSNAACTLVGYDPDGLVATLELAPNVAVANPFAANSITRISKVAGAQAYAENGFTITDPNTGKIYEIQVNGGIPSFVEVGETEQPDGSTDYYVTVTHSVAGVIAYLEPSETEASYHRYFWPFLRNQETAPVVGLCKLRHIEVENDNEELPITNLNALRWMLRSLQAEQETDWERSAFALNEAVKILNKELKSYRSPDQIGVPRVTFTDGGQRAMAFL